MENNKLYHGFRFPGEIISHAVWLYHKFILSYRDGEEILASRGIEVTYESIRQWCRYFGQANARKTRAKQTRFRGTWYLDEMFIKIKGKPLYLWRVVDQGGDALDILVQSRKDTKAARKFFCKLFKGLQYLLNIIVTDKLKSYGAAHREMGLLAVQEKKQYQNNRTENSHQPTRQQENQMRRFKSAEQAQRFLFVHAAVNNLSRQDRYLMTAYN
jgi:putative transposase